MQETENTWHSKPRVAEICNSGAYYNLEHAFLPIIFVALLAELEKRGEEATRERARVTRAVVCAWACSSSKRKMEIDPSCSSDVVVVSPLLLSGEIAREERVE